MTQHEVENILNGFDLNQFHLKFRLCPQSFYSYQPKIDKLIEITRL